MRGNVKWEQMMTAARGQAPLVPLSVVPTCLAASLPLRLAGLVELESTLLFLGLGLPPDVASWGRLLDAARLDPAAWWTAAFPVLALLLTTGALLTLSRD